MPPRVWEYDERENTTAGLEELCREWVKPDWVVCEVGCFAGVSTAVFAAHAHHVHAVDPWTLATGYREIPRKMIEDAERRFADTALALGNITTHRAFSVDAAGRFEPASLDMVYIDAEHTEAAFRADVQAWLPKIKAGGLLAGHDFETVRNWLPRKPELIYSDTSWVIQC